MSIEVKVPQLPESVADATLVAWHKKPGDAVARDENLVDLETDKVVLEVPAPSAGVITEINVEDGATVTSGDLLALIEEGAAPEKPTSDDKQDQTTQPAAKQSVEAKKAQPQETAGSESSGLLRLSPSVRRLIEEHGIDIARLRGSGRDGRVTKADVLEHLESGASESPSAARVAAPATARQERRVPMTRLRSRIADRMVEAQHTAAMLTSFNEVDLSEVMALRKRYKESFEKKHGARLGFMSFFAKAAVEALRRFPTINASLDGKDIVYHDYFDIGVAVSTERGLMVPVLRDVDQLSFAGIEKAIVAYAGKARDGSIAIEDLTGGTFTITNGGVFGSLLSTPILNMPQSAILGMHTIKERPVVVDGDIVARPMMYLALTYDHRIVDGGEAVQFLVCIKDVLEDPARLMLQV